MRERHDPWRWPISIGTALGLFLAVIFLTPQAWVDIFFSPLNRDFSSLASGQRAWLEILPPPILEMQQAPDPKPEVPSPPPQPRPVASDARWWTEGWRVRTVESVAADLQETRLDSIAVVLEMLDLTPDILSLARPDSVLASRLHLMRIEDSFRFDELKPYLGAMTRARAYRDILSRAADMYGDFLQSDIMVPD